MRTSASKKNITIAGITEADSTKRGAPNIKGSSTKSMVDTTS